MSGLVSRAYATNGLNQYQTAGPATFGYDGNGNLTSDGTTGYSYDAENRLISTTVGAALTYDALGRLYSTTGTTTGTTTFLYDGDALVAEYDGSGTLLRRYVHGNDEDDPIVWYEGATLSTPRSLQIDTQGSITSIADASGASLTINTYDEYGIPGASNAGRFQYTGQAWIPELGMYYYKARLYSPTLGRFLQTDPIGYGDQVNLYAYVGNDPVDGRDPSGLAGGPGTNGWLPEHFLEDVAETVERGARFGLARIGGAVTLLATAQLAGPSFNSEAEGRINRIRARIDNRQNVVNDRHISAALREARGEVVRVNPRDGQPYDHINELREAHVGLMRDIRAMQEQFGHNLGEDQAMRAVNSIGKASRMLDTIDRVLDRVGWVCTGTRICP